MAEPNGKEPQKEEKIELGTVDLDMNDVIKPEEDRLTAAVTSSDPQDGEGKPSTGPETVPHALPVNDVAKAQNDIPLSSSPIGSGSKDSLLISEVRATTKNSGKHKPIKKSPATSKRKTKKPKSRASK